MRGDKKLFIRALAAHLVENQAEHSMGLVLGKDEAIRWALLRDTTPLRGWQTVEEAEQILAEWLLGEELT